MNERINIRQLKELMDITPVNQNIMLIGKHGIGKSEILEKYYAEKGMKVVTLFLGQMSDPGDLIGLPYKNKKTGRTDFLAPYWFPKEDESIVLFLDELNRARPEILQAVMDLALNKKLAGKKLPEGSRVISAVNYGDEYDLVDLDPALLSRFNVYEFKPDVAEWIYWATENNIDERIIKFISENEEFLDGKNKFKSEENTDSFDKTPDRRGWNKVSEIIMGKNLDEKMKAYVSGIIGKGCCCEFFEYVNNMDMVTPKELLYGNFENTADRMKNYNAEKFSLLNEKVFEFLEKEKVRECDKESVGKNFMHYWNFLKENNQREAMGNFVNFINEKNNPKVLNFIVCYCEKLFLETTNFIAELKRA